MAKKNASSLRIADRYARALFPLVAGDEASAVAGELSELSALLGENADFAALANNPVIAPAEKAKIVAALLASWKARPLTARFVTQLASAGRLGALGEVARAFARMVAVAAGEVAIEIVSAKPLSDAERTKIEAGLGAGAKATVTVDPALVAGVIVRRGSKQLDYSLAGKLRQIRAAVEGERMTA